MKLLSLSLSKDTIGIKLKSLEGRRIEESNLQMIQQEHVFKEKQVKDETLLIVTSKGLRYWRIPGEVRPEQLSRKWQVYQCNPAINPSLPYLLGGHCELDGDG